MNVRNTTQRNQASKTPKTPNASVIEVFPTPIVKFRFPKHEKYFFRDIPKSEDRTPEGWNCSVNSSYPFTGENDPYVPDEVNKRLQRDVMGSIRDVFIKNGLPPVEMGAFWYNIYHEEQNQERHDHVSAHANTFLSGVYYNKNATPTTFYPPSTLYRTLRFRGCEGTIIGNATRDTFEAEVNDGDIILFPPYLEHEVKKQTSESMRLTFSFNLTTINPNSIEWITKEY
jgi:hypothetical protein|tara:strand:- start:14072 stop:14755 length:684 start_codon:yes stop_codon:yes gene_type:complete